MKGIYKISIYIIIPPPLSFLDLDPNTALRRQADLWGLGSKMLEMRGRYDVAYYSPYLSFLCLEPPTSAHYLGPSLKHKNRTEKNSLFRIQNDYCL